MHIQIETLPKSEVKLTVRLDDADMKPSRKAALIELGEKVKIDGFRPGKAPDDVIIQHVGEQTFKAHMMDHAIEISYEKAIQEKELRPVAYPKLSIKGTEPLEYEAVVAVYPKLSWKKDLKKLKIKAKELKVEDKDIQEVLENLQRQATNWVKTDRAAKMGDRVELDFAGREPGSDEVLPGTKAEHQTLTMGDKKFIPGFEEAIEGMKAGDEKTFPVTFPKDYHVEDFKNKKVEFTVKIHSVEEPKSPELTDEFAMQMTGGNRKTMEELKGEIKEELMKQRRREEEARQDNEFLKEMKDFVEGEIPEALIDREIHTMIERMEADLKKQNRTLDDYIAELKEKGKDLHKELHPTAHDQMLVRLGLEMLQEEQPLEVSDDELALEVEEMINWYPEQYRPMIAERYKEGSRDREMVKGQLKLRKYVVKHLE